MNNDQDYYSIAAPFCTVEELEPLLKAGVSEAYFGIMTDQWKKRYGDAEFITRRQSQLAHISSFRQFPEIIEIVSEYHATATLVVNADYSEEQMPYVLEIISEWEGSGGNAVMVSDLGVLMHLQWQNSRLARYLSVMAGVFNHESVAFFHQLGVSRVVLPRELKLIEMNSIVRNSVTDMEFEVISMFQKCQYIDSFCNFIHAVNEGSFQINRDTPGHRAVNLCHGCAMPFYSEGIRVIPLPRSETNTPYCAACQLTGLVDIGIRHFKIAGRGYAPHLILKAASFIKYSIERLHKPDDEIIAEYTRTFGTSCKKKFCYYSK